MPVIYKPFLEKVGGDESASTYVGNVGELFYDPTTTTLRISDGETAGGVEVSGGGGGGSTTALRLEDGGAVIENDGDLTISNTDDDIVINTRNGGDDIFIYSGDRVVIEGGSKTEDLQGGNINIYAGDGGPDSGTGGQIIIKAGNAGNTTGTGAMGGNIEIEGGRTTETGSEGGIVWIFGGPNIDDLRGEVRIGVNNSWFFNENQKSLHCPVGLVSQLGEAAGNGGARGFVTDSVVPAVGNFGEIVAGEGGYTVPVFSDGVNWLIG